MAAPETGGDRLVHGQTKVRRWRRVKLRLACKKPSRWYGGSHRDGSRQSSVLAWGGCCSPGYRYVK